MKKIKRVTIKDIASELGVSLSTVNKALTGKNGISLKKKEQILAVADRLGYKVNKVAQSLARKEIKIGIIMPSDWPQFYEFIKKGLEYELERLTDFNIKGVFKCFSHKENFDEKIRTAVNDLINEGVNAIIISPTNSNYEKVMTIIEEKKIPLILLGSDITSYGSRLTAVSVDAGLSGRMAAEMIRIFLPKDNSAAIYIGNKDIEAHNEKVIGFMEEANWEMRYKQNEINPIPVAGVFETYDEPELAYKLTEKLLKERQDIGAIYVATGNSNEVCRYIEENGYIGKVKIISTDIDEKQIKYMSMGIIAAIIHQNAELQGKLAIRAIYSYLSEGNPPEDRILVTPQIALRCSLGVNNIR